MPGQPRRFGDRAGAAAVPGEVPDLGATYDTGALVAADRGERRMWARHRALLAARAVPTAPTPVVAQAWRGGSRQALLARLLRGCDVEALDNDLARNVGGLAARAGTTDVVHACVAEGALRRRDLVITADPEDVMALAAAVNRHLEVERP